MRQVSQKVEVMEWYFTNLMTVVGLYVFCFPSSISVSHMRLISEVFNPVVLGVVCMSVGGIRAIVLMYFAYNFRLRLTMGAFSALIWLEMTIDFMVRLWTNHLIAPPGLMMLGAQFIGECYLIREYLRAGRKK